MKKFYENPTMALSLFDGENVVITESAVGASETSTTSVYGSSTPTGAKAKEILWDNIQFTG